MRRTLNVLALAFALAVLLPLVALAQVVTPETPPDQVLPLVLEGLQTSNWWLALPGIVWLVVAGLRKFGAALVPWFATQMGGLMLAFAASLASAVLETTLSGAVWTVPVMIGVVFKVLYGFLGAMGVQSGQKNALQAMKAPAA